MNADLTLICHKCRLPIEGDTGYLRVTYPDLHKYREQEREYSERHPEGEAVSITEFLLGPEEIHWLPYHDKCEPEPDLDAYQIDAVQLQSWQCLARWTAHLMSKNWLPHTDWDELLREVSGESKVEQPRILVRLRDAA